MTRRVFLGCDHAGVELKEKLKRELILKSSALKIEIDDLGTNSMMSVDYPDYADLVAKKIHGFQLVPSEKDGDLPLPAEMGILICGSGQGMAIRANKYTHIRAALCWTEEVARLSREHNDANILCMGGRLIDHDLAIKITETFLTTKFLGGRHLQRVQKLGSSC